jgi:hypothetical protein
MKTESGLTKVTIEADFSIQNMDFGLPFGWIQSVSHHSAASESLDVRSRQRRR